MSVVRNESNTHIRGAANSRAQLIEYHSVGASNLMAGNRKLVRKVTVLLKAISLVL